MEMTRRALMMGGLTGAMGLGLGGCGPRKAGELADVTLGLSTTKEGYQNFFAPAGQDRTPYRVNYAILPFDLSLQSISDGRLDAGSNFSDIPLAIWGAKMQESRIVAVIRADARSRYLGLVVRKGLPARGIADLRGKRIGYLRSSNYHYYLLRLLEEHGMTMKDIEGISLARDMLPAAFQSGQLDAWMTQGYETAIAQSRFGGRLIEQAESGYVGNPVVVTNVNSIDDPLRNQAIGDYLLRFRRVLEWMHAHSDEWATILAAQTGVGRADYLEWRRQEKSPPQLVPVDDRAIREQAEAAATFARAGLIEKPLDLRHFWDRRFTALLNG
ncbi:MAG: ABC transporter substrate-binding protein [Sphingobium sp.]